MVVRAPAEGALAVYGSLVDEFDAVQLFDRYRAGQGPHTLTVSADVIESLEIIETEVSTEASGDLMNPPRKPDPE